MSMLRSLSFTLALLSAFLARPSHAGHRTVYGTFTGTSGIYDVRETTADGPQSNEVGLTFTAPKWDGRAENGAEVGFDRLQAVVIETNLLMVAEGRYENTSGQPREWWVHDQGVRAWYSLNGVACGDVPEGVNVFGGNYRTWTYGGRHLAGFDGNLDYSGASGGTYVGVGSQSIVERLWIDPRRLRALRPICGPGQMNITLNVRSAYAELFVGHWLAEAETSVAVQGLWEDPTKQVRVTFVYADPGSPVYAHTVSPWVEIGYLASPDMEAAPVPGVGYAQFVGDATDDVSFELPRVATLTPPVSATLECSQRAWSMFGVENVDDADGMCGGGSVEYMRVGLPFDMNGVGFNHGVGSSNTPLTDFDGNLDYHGTSGVERLGSSSIWMDHEIAVNVWNPGAFTLGPTFTTARLQSAGAAFVPLTSTGIFGWWYRAMMHAQARLVMREQLP